ncbi:hypothetical protein G4V62_01890 [Bacillaceae bacterium SIJ1]|uniref:stalk domain-containing protein n=1 Tax=Litoribacterium kuwaitense TaxID=1398745 RepID=UPI0013ECC855|nr:stalk domain-containing protein [Litoribacterium kuwaitense]NGP43774.1 hypothetical protein [Litoribacterium kuwaitense]
MKQHLLSSILGAGLLLAQPSADNISIKVDGMTMDVESAAFIEDGRTFVPFRAVAEALDVHVNWNPSSQQVTTQSDEGVVRMTVGNTEAEVNKQSVHLDAPPMIREGRTFVPIRFIAESLGTNVQWQSDTQTVNITTEATELYTLGFYGLGSFQQRDAIAELSSTAFTWGSISKEGHFQMSRSTDGKLNDYYWPENHPDASTDEIIDLSLSNGRDAWFMVHGINRDHIASLLHSEAKQKEAIAEIVAVADENDFSGVMIDFEGFTPEDKKLSSLYTTFLDQLDEALNKKQLALSVAIAPPNNFFSEYEYEQIGQIVDMAVVMLYDYHPEGDAHQRPEPMNLVKKGLEETLHFIPREKVLVGINLVHETPETMGEKIELANTYRTKGVSLWLLRQYTDDYQQAMSETTDDLKD